MDEMHSCNVPRLVVAAPHGRSGKTTTTIALLTALKATGYSVQPYKKGPDFIDPSWMTRVTGRPCRNLDSFLMDRETLRASFARGALDVDIAVVEGAMGLYDGVDLEGSGSTAEIAKAIGAPVLLVVDTTRMTRSVAAMILGFMRFDPEINLAGVILNKVARPRHEQMLRAAIERYCGIPVLGVIPRGKQFNIPDRHLGLIPAAEDDDLASDVEIAGRDAAAFLDLQAIIQIARKVYPIEVDQLQLSMPLMHCNGLTVLKPEHPRARVAVFLDRAFTFYYPENLEALAAAGAELVPVNAIQDEYLPEVDAAYIGGGFPEIFAADLAANAGLKKDLREMVENGLPVYAECGGLMYLGRKLKWNGQEHEMTGILPFDVSVTDKPQGHGYIALAVLKENLYFKEGEQITGHEFHHSKVENLEQDKVQFAFRVTRGFGLDGKHDGLIYKNVLACYTHLHSAATPGWAAKLVAAGAAHKHKII